MSQAAPESPSIQTESRKMTTERAIEFTELSDDEIELVAGGAGAAIDPNGRP